MSGSADRPSTPTTALIPRQRRIALGLWLLLGAILISSGWVAREWIKRASERPVDGAALPRPEVNAPFVRTPDKIVNEMLELAEVGPDDIVYDLGCGDGRIVVAAARQFGCRCYGYDINPDRVAEARENARRNGVEDLVQIEQQDIFTLDLSEATVVMLYLLPRLNVKLIPQLDRMRDGARIVSHDFDMEGIEPDRVVQVKNEHGDLESILYLWKPPLTRKAKAPKR
jgi:SAM-dependent methyltransferase